MQRITEQLIRWRNLNDASIVNDADPVRKVTDNGQVMGNEHIGQTALTLELVHQVQNLGTNRDIKCRNRLIGDDELRVHDHGPRNADTLTLAAGELMRIARLVFRKKTDRLKHRIYLGFPVRFILVQMKVVQPFRNAVVNRRTLIERSGRILEDHLDVADNLPLLLLGDLAIDFLALEKNFAIRRRCQTDNRPRRRCLTRTGFTDKSKCLALVDLEVCVLDSPEAMLAVIVEGNLEMSYIQQARLAIQLIRHLINRQFLFLCRFLFHVISAHRRHLLSPSLPAYACADP